MFYTLIYTYSIFYLLQKAYFMYVILLSCKACKGIFAM